MALLRERILVTAKTYPTLSKKYGELVCTAGVREDGSGVRLYPVPFRRLDDKDRYAKYDLIDTVLVKSRSDPRPETYHPQNPNDFQEAGHGHEGPVAGAPTPAPRKGGCQGEPTVARGIQTQSNS